MRRLTCICALASLGLGCATAVVRENPDNPAMAEALLAEVKGTSAQMLSGAWRDEAFYAECVLKGDGDRFTAVLLSSQMRLATLSVESPHTVRWERAPQLPSSLDPEDVIFDLCLVLLPSDTLKKAIGDGYRVDETADGKRRVVVDLRRGRVQSVRQELPDGGVYFRNAQYGYEITARAMAHGNQGD